MMAESIVGFKMVQVTLPLRTKTLPFSYSDSAVLFLWLVATCHSEASRQLTQKQKILEANKKSNDLKPKRPSCEAELFVPLPLSCFLHCRRERISHFSQGHSSKYAHMRHWQSSPANARVLRLNCRYTVGPLLMCILSLIVYLSYMEQFCYHHMYCIPF